MQDFDNMNSAITISPSMQKLKSQYTQLNKLQKGLSNTSERSIIHHLSKQYSDNQSPSVFFQSALKTYEQTGLTSSQFNPFGSRLSNQSQFLSPNSTQKYQLTQSMIQQNQISSSNLMRSFIKSELDPTQSVIVSSVCSLYEGSSNARNDIQIAKLKIPFYLPNGQLKDTVHYNQYFGQNDMSIEEFENTNEPYEYLKISSRNGDVISASTVKQNQAIKLISSIRESPSSQ